MTAEEGWQIQLARMKESGIEPSPDLDVETELILRDLLGNEAVDAIIAEGKEAT